jgi:hypothetical protein
MPEIPEENPFLYRCATFFLEDSHAENFEEFPFTTWSDSYLNIAKLLQNSVLRFDTASLKPTPVTKMFMLKDIERKNFNPQKSFLCSAFNCY